MVVTRSQQKIIDITRLRIIQAYAFVQFMKERIDTGLAPNWQLVLYPSYIDDIPQCLRDLAKSKVVLHKIFNWETLEERCYGWQWVDVMYQLCYDLDISVHYEIPLGRGGVEDIHRYGRDAFIALSEFTSFTETNPSQVIVT